jgi:hypothetical protein
LVLAFEHKLQKIGASAPKHFAGWAGGEFRCSQCAAAFPTSKALQQNRRNAHSERRQASACMGREKQCLACGFVFSNRCRGLAHLNDKRRNARCREAILAGNVLPRLADVQQELVEVARIERAKARSSGHTQPLSTRGLYS